MHIVLHLVLWVAIALCAARGRAEDALSAEQALAAGEFEAATRLATQAVEAGDSNPRELMPLYLVLARAHALLGHEKEARHAFAWVLALEPSFRLEPAAPTEIRSPYMEARGDWSSYAVPLRADVTVAEDLAAVDIRVEDPAHLAARVRLRARLPGTKDFVEHVKAPAALVRVDLPGLERVSAVELSVALLDEHGNRIYEQASDAEPLSLKVLTAPVDAKGASSPSPVPEPAPVSDRSKALFVGGGVTLAVGAGALAGAIVAHLERERMAERWNSGDCDGSGDTRAEVCADESSAIERAEVVAGSLYGVGGAAVITGLVLLAVAPSKRGAREQANARTLACGRGPARLGLACSMRF